MKIKTIEHTYIVDGTEKEVREYAQELREKYAEVSVYPTPFDDRIVCTGEKIQYCTLCDGEFSNPHTCI